MERFTKKNAKGNAWDEILEDGSEAGLNAALKKLSEYEDAEESGNMVCLPCKAGDYVWFVDDYLGLYDAKVVRGLVEGYWWTPAGFSLDVVWDEPIMGARYKRRYMELTKVGESVFLSEKEAVKKQKELLANKN